MTIRQYKKKYFICKDDHGKMIYAGDTVEIQLPYETRTSYQSVVYWNRLDGAYVKSHPTHIQMKMGPGHRNLRDFMGQKSFKMTNSDTDEEYLEYSKCVKVKSFYH